MNAFTAIGLAAGLAFIGLFVADTLLARGGDRTSLRNLTLALRCYVVAIGTQVVAEAEQTVRDWKPFEERNR